MEAHESSLREILSSTRYFLRKHNEPFYFNVSHNQLRSRYEVQVMMGRLAFEEVYCFEYSKLKDQQHCKYLYQRFGSEILKNLELNTNMYK